MPILLFPKNEFLHTEFLYQSLYTFTRFLISICLAFDPASPKNIASQIAPFLAAETSDQVLLHQQRPQLTQPASCVWVEAKPSFSWSNWLKSICVATKG